MNLDLLREFNLEAAKRGEEICWSDNTETLKLIAEAGPDGEYALKRDDGNNYLAGGIQLRMKPLAWVGEKPVYRDSVLYSKYTGHAYLVGEVEVLDWDAVTWVNPKPVKNTRTVKFLGYMRGDGRLVLLDESKRFLYKRVPSEDKTCEVEE